MKERSVNQAQVRVDIRRPISPAISFMSELAPQGAVNHSFVHLNDGQLNACHTN